MKPSLRFSESARRSCACIIVLFLLGTLPTAHAGLGDEPLATDHWAYEVIDELYAAGIWGSWPIGTRPWYRGDIALRLTEISDRIDFGDDYAWLISKLQSEFSDDMQPEKRKGDFETRLGGGVFGLAAFEKYEDALWRGRLSGYLGIGTGPWWVRTRGDIDSHGDRDRTFFGKPWQDKLTGTVDLALFSLRFSGLALLIGRDYMRWGAGSHDVLLLNDQQPPFDMARFSYHHKYFDFSFFLTGLDSAFTHPADDSIYSTANVKRYFAGHRLEVRPLRGLQVGVSEVVVWGGISRQLEAYYLNPFLPYYWEQLNADRDDNPLWSFDASYLIPQGPMLYGEFLIDDFQIDFKSEPHQVGWLLGFNWSRPVGLRGSYVTFDWTHIEPGVYGQPQPYNRYLNHRVVMGSNIGNDAERVFLRWRQHVSQPFDVSGRIIHVGKGERRPETPQTGGVPRGAFPSGIVERTTECALDLFYYPNAHTHLRLDGGYRWQANADNVEGRDRNGAFVSLSVTLMGWHTGSSDVTARLLVPAYAKINLALYVLGKRPDGFHDIATVLQAVDLHDTVAFQIDSAPLSLACSDPDLATDESNLVTRAVRLLEKECDRELPVSVRLEKRIPIGAGMGGGSSDAAATLWAVNHLFDLGIDREKLQVLAAELGSDVPFFLTAGQALAEGRGELLTELDWPLQYHVLIAFPHLCVSASEGYARARMSLTNPLVDCRISRYLAPENFWSWTRSQSNDLAAGVSDTYPKVARGIEAMRALGAHHVGVTGSGSAVFGLFRSSPSADDLESWPADGTWLLQTAQPLRTPGCPMPAYGMVSRRG